MNKKVLATLLVAATATTLGAGMAYAEDGHKVSVAAWDKNFNIPALEAAAEDYKANVDPDFELEIIEQSQSSDIENAITTAGSAGDYSTLPDIVLFQDHYFQRYHNDYPDAWQSMEEAGVDWDDFGAEKLSFSTIEGTHYGVPVDNGTVVFAYRTDLLEEAGYTIDDMTGCTWDKFIEVGKAVYEKTGKYLLSMDGDGNDLPYMMLQAEGTSQFKDGKPYITENEKMVAVITKIKEMGTHVPVVEQNDFHYTCRQQVASAIQQILQGADVETALKDAEDQLTFAMEG